MRPKKASTAQRNQIKVILNMPKDRPFNRCRGKSWRKLKALAAKGDKTHHGKDHAPCEVCRCDNAAGSHTKGDFYGLGPETGTLGVGLCMFCLLSDGMHIWDAYSMAKHEVEMMQKYGSVRDDTEYALAVAKQEAVAARETVKVRQEMQLVQDALADFKRQLSETDREKKPTEYIAGAAVPMSDKTRYDLMLRIANTISRLNLDAYRLDAAKFVPIEAVLIAADELRATWQNSVRMAEQLATQKAVTGACDAGEEQVSEYVMRVANQEWQAVWARVQKQCGRKAAT